VFLLNFWIIRASEKNNYPILLVFRPDFGVPLSGEYPDMPRSARLEFGPKSGATLGYLFISEALTWFRHSIYPI